MLDDVTKKELKHGVKRQELIDDLISVREKFPNKNINREIYRAEGKFREYIWIDFFGNFPSFKQAAQISYSNSERRIVRQVAKRSSVVDLRKYNQEKYGWSDVYTKNWDERFQNFLVISDVHDILCDPFVRRMFVQAAKNINPSKIIFNGDLFDLPEFSSYVKKPQEWIGKERRLWVWKFLSELRDVSPDSEFILIEGNHEYRLVKYLTEKAPMVMDILFDEGWGAKEFLGLAEFEVNYYSRADFGTFSEADIQNVIKRNYYKFQDKVMFHHFPEGRMFGIPGCSGHHHKFKAWDLFNVTYGSYNWFQTGGGARQHVDYLNTMGEKWQNGFMVVTVDLLNSRNTIFNYIDCTNELCNIQGDIYIREGEERLFLL